MKTKFSSCISLILECCKITQDITKIKELIPSINNWDDFIDISYAHGVFPLIYRTLKNFADIISLDVLNEMKLYNMNIVKQNMLMTAELIKVMNILEENGIEAIAFKGPTLSQMAYGNITRRQYADLDILIEDKDKTKAINLLTSLHYQPEIILKENTKRSFYKDVNVIGFDNTHNNIYVEIHWGLISKNYAIDFSSLDLFKSRTITINQKSINLLSEENNLIYLAVHGSKHFFERVSWICDIDRSIRTDTSLDWNLLLKKAQKIEVLKILLVSLCISKRLFNTPLDIKVIKLIEADSSIEKIASEILDMQTVNTQRSSKNFFLLLNMKDSFYKKMEFSVKAFTSTKYPDYEFYQLPSYLNFLYLFLRPIRLFIKYINFQ